MGLFGSKGGSQESSSQTQNQNGTSTTTPNLPGYLSYGVGDYYNDVGNLINYYGSGTNGGYGAQFTPGASTDQTTAYTNAGQLGGYQPTLTSATDLATSASSAPANTSAATTIAPVSTYSASTFGPSSLLTNLQSYINPQINDVINTTDALYNKQIGQTNAALENQGALSGAFGGSRFGLAQGEQNADNSMNEASVNSNLYNQAFTQGAALSNEDADRAQAAAAANAQAENAAAAQNAAAQNTYGLSQAQLTQNNNQFNANQAETAQNRALTGAGLLGTLANDENSNQINDVNTQLAAGQDDRSVQQQQDQQYLTMLSEFQGLLGLNPSSLIGSTQTANSTSNTSGSKDTATESVGLK